MSDRKSNPDSFWEDPEVVERFASRAPDQRLLALLDDYEDPGAIRVLDIGCAGGRNTVLLAEAGFDVHARDSSSAMVAETRRRVARLLGKRAAEARVRPGRMDELAEFGDRSFDLVVSLGVLHQARSWSEWERAAAETARVLRTGGRFLVSAFTPETDLTGSGVRPVPGEQHVYEGLPGGRAVLLEPAALDAELARFGFEPELPTTIGRTVTGETRRVSANGLYRATG
ncbi:MAG TPA: class I SAM-dependent methyltransferase [Gemmatimonadaceae bacterium]|jgi:SAM-dependent methyltransferase|nr:class I SAM-dependent methyltransferase [Gemmatimonadaceae bacterium]